MLVRVCIKPGLCALRVCIEPDLCAQRNFCIFASLGYEIAPGLAGMVYTQPSAMTLPRGDKRARISTPMHVQNFTCGSCPIRCIHSMTDSQGMQWKCKHRVSHQRELSLFCWISFKGHYDRLLDSIALLNGCSLEWIRLLLHNYNV